MLDNDARFELTDEEIKRLNPIFIGSQDIEDSISIDTWKSIIDGLFEESLRLTTDEIDGLKRAIPNDKKIASNQKFYPRIKNLIKTKLIALKRDDFQTVDDLLPAKGKESVHMIKKYIKSIDQIDKSIVETLKIIKTSS